MKTRDFHFFSGPGLRLARRLYLPDAQNDLHAGAVFCHGFGGVKEGVPVGLCTRLSEAGYTMLSFDYRGFGASEGQRALLLPQDQVEDTVTALEYLATQVPGLDPERLGIYGTSFGGGIAAAAAARSTRPKALVMTVPVTSGSHWLRSICRWHEFEILRERALAAIAHKAATGEIEIGERLEIMMPDPRSMARYAEHTPMAIETAFHVLHHEPVAHAHALTMPVLMLGAKDDSLVPYEQTTMFFERVTAPKRLEAFAVGNHWLFYDEGLPRAAEFVTDWFAQHLR
ncbi:MAG: alpha/beta fold hydrolase [Variovorax sp.]|nr:alpha/beta fold hydrolase [Variovorax sp.]